MKLTNGQGELFSINFYGYLNNSKESAYYLVCVLGKIGMCFILTNNKALCMLLYFQ
jgi:hypothetical protein